MIFTYTKGGVSRQIRIADERCDELLDRLSATMPANPAMDARWFAMMAKREAALQPKKENKKRR